MQVFELKEEPLNKADIASLKAEVKNASTGINKLKTIIAITMILAFAVAGFFYFSDKDITAMQISLGVGVLLAAIFGSLILFSYDMWKSARKTLAKGTKDAIIGTITDKQIRTAQYKNNKGEGRSSTYMEFYFGPHKDINVQNKAVYDQFEVGDKVKAYYDFRRESILNNADINEVIEVELLLKAQDNPVDLALFKREANEYNKQLKQHDEEKLMALSNKRFTLSAYDRKKLTLRFGRFVLVNLLCIVLGIITLPVGLIGLVFIFFGIIFLLLTIIKYMGDLLKNVKIIDLKQVHEIRKMGGKKYMRVVIKLSAKRKKDFSIKTQEIDDYDFSKPVLLHRGGFSRNIFDLTFKTKTST